MVPVGDGDGGVLDCVTVNDFVADARPERLSVPDSRDGVSTLDLDGDRVAVNVKLSIAVAVGECVMPDWVCVTEREALSVPEADPLPLGLGVGVHPDRVLVRDSSLVACGVSEAVGDSLVRVGVWDDEAVRVTVAAAPVRDKVSVVMCVRENEAFLDVSVDDKDSEVVTVGLPVTVHDTVNERSGVAVSLDGESDGVSDEVFLFSVTVGEGDSDAEGFGDFSVPVRRVRVGVSEKVSASTDRDRDMLPERSNRLTDFERDLDSVMERVADRERIPVSEAVGTEEPESDSVSDSVALRSALVRVSDAVSFFVCFVTVGDGDGLSLGRVRLMLST